MKNSFKNRIKELQLLDDLYKQKKSKLIILYGRRRVGKTQLLQEFLKKHQGLYILARQESQTDQLKKISSQIAEHYQDELLKHNPFSNWDALFIYLAQKPRIPIVFDEFPYIVQSTKSITGLLQDYWDNYFSKKDAFIILCGSSITMMEKLLHKSSPIYGRRTEQILLEPLTFKDACLFFPQKLDFKQKVIYYAIVGGMPAYLLELDYNKQIKENIIENIAQKNKFLYQDVLFTLREELQEPRNYFSILYSIAKGNTKQAHIVNDTGLEKSFINKYLSVLINLQLIERKVPITEKNYAKSRNGIYILRDNFFKFWFKFIFENLEYIEQEKQEKLFNEKILPNLHSFTGIIFEQIVLSELMRNKKYENYLFGKWWDKHEEVDVVGIDHTNKQILIGEVKFKTLTPNDIHSIKNNLLKKVKKINTFNYKLELVIINLNNQHTNIQILSI
ncbi:MAG: ATP-binding protein [Candidatus Woesearchaeota archaeon]